VTMPATTPANATALHRRRRFASASSNRRTSASQRGQVPRHSPLKPHSSVSHGMSFCRAIPARISFKVRQTSLPRMRIPPQVLPFVFLDVFFPRAVPGGDARAGRPRHTMQRRSVIFMTNKTLEPLGGVRYLGLDVSALSGEIDFAAV